MCNSEHLYATAAKLRAEADEVEASPLLDIGDARLRRRARVAELRRFADAEERRAEDLAERESLAESAAERGRLD